MIIVEIFERGCAQQYSPDQPRGPRFAHASLLEEEGFELVVPLSKRTAVPNSSFGCAPAHRLRAS